MIDEKYMFLRREYEAGASVPVLAEKYKKSKSSIIRYLKKTNTKFRTKSQAQKNNLKNGGKHPTKGRHRTNDEKIKMAMKLKENWDSLSEAEKKNRIDSFKEELKKAKKNNEKILQKANKKLKEATKKGSKLEAYLSERLREDGFDVVRHFEKVLPNDNMHFDIYITNCQKPIVIEVDGPTHQRPVYGEDRFNAQLEADNRKNMLCLSEGISIIRVFNDYINISFWQKDEIYNKVKEAVEQTQQKEEAEIINIGEVNAR